MPRLPYYMRAVSQASFGGIHVLGTHIFENLDRCADRRFQEGRPRFPEVQRRGRRRAGNTKQGHAPPALPENSSSIATSAEMRAPSCEDPPIKRSLPLREGSRNSSERPPTLSSRTTNPFESASTLRPSGRFSATAITAFPSAPSGRWRHGRRRERFERSGDGIDQPFCASWKKVVEPGEGLAEDRGGGRAQGQRHRRSGTAPSSRLTSPGSPGVRDGRFCPHRRSDSLFVGASEKQRLNSASSRSRGLISVSHNHFRHRRCNPACRKHSAISPTISTMRERSIAVMSARSCSVTLRRIEEEIEFDCRQAAAAPLGQAPSRSLRWR